MAESGALDERVFHCLLQKVRSAGNEHCAVAVSGDHFRQELASKLVRERWLKCIEDDIDLSTEFPDDVLNQFDDCLNIIGECFEKHSRAASEKGMASDELKEYLLMQIRVVLFQSLSTRCQKVLSYVFNAAFAVYCRSRFIADPGLLLDANATDDLCFGCRRTDDLCICVQMWEKFGLIMKKITELRLLDVLAYDPAVNVAFNAVTAKVQALYAATGYAQSCLDDLKKWIKQRVLPWLEKLFSVSLLRMDRVADRLRQELYRAVGHCLICKLFDLALVSYPDTAPVLVDLSVCLDRTKLRLHLTDTLSKDVDRRLLHIGVNTPDVLLAYTTAVKSLRALDPKGIIMQAVCQPIRQYLRRRTDTVRCIVSFLTDPSQDELGLELNNMVAPGADAIHHDIIEATGDDEQMAVEDDYYFMQMAASTANGSQSLDADWMCWKPDPIDAPIEHGGRGRRAATDLLSMLVGIYGSKDLFVKEYRQLLSERLIRAERTELESEFRYLEQLKARFGDNELQQCEVMLKDMKDSARIDESCKDKGLPFPVSTRIVSSHFWPKLREERIKLPPSLQRGLTAYEKHFKALKASRRLEFVPSLGSVVIDLTLSNGQSSGPLTVSPFDAAILHLFSKNDIYTLDDLCKRLEARSSTIKRRMTWWQSVGLFELATEGAEVWRLCTVAPNADRLRSHLESNDPESDDEQSQQESDVDNLEMYWTYISGLIKNTDLKAERVHSLLQMFTSPGQQGPTLATVTAFLQRKVKKGLLVFSGGLYKPASKTPSNSARSNAAKK